MSSGAERAHGAHEYRTTLRWRGSTGLGYDDYDRNHEIDTEPRTTTIEVSSDPAFRGDASLLNPEALLVAAAMSCQLLSFLAIAARARLDVVGYTDAATGEMPTDIEPISITRIVLRPAITIATNDPPPEDKVRRLVDLAHGECYIANSLRSEIVVEPSIRFVTPPHIEHVVSGV